MEGYTKGQTLGILFFEQTYLMFLRQSQKSPKSDFQSHFFMSKIELILLIFFFIEEYKKRRATFVIVIF